MEPSEDGIWGHFNAVCSETKMEELQKYGDILGKAFAWNF